jgi:molybdate transport system permease protein
MFALSAEEWEIIRLSLKVAVWSVAWSLPLAVMVAFLLARSSFPGKSLFDAVVHLPLVLPPVVVGYFLLLLLGRRGPLGALLDEYFGIVVAFRWSGAAIAAGIMGFPLMVRAIRLSIERCPAYLPAPCCRLRAASANSARRSPSSRTYRARRAHCRWRSIR